MPNLETFDNHEVYTGEAHYKEVYSSVMELTRLPEWTAAPDQPMPVNELVRSPAFAAAIQTTPLVERSHPTDDVQVYQKREDLRETGAFKEQGAFWSCERALQNDPGLNTFVAYSAGNHGLGVARFVRQLNERRIADGSIRLQYGQVHPEDVDKLAVAHIFCGATASDDKKSLLRAWGANLHTKDQDGNDYKDLEAAADGAADFLQNASQSAHLVRPFDDPDVMAGQGNTLLSTVAQLQEAGVDTAAQPLYVYTAGGGLGLSLGSAVCMEELVKAGVLHPDSKVVAVQMEHCDSAKRGLAWLDAGITDMHGLFLDSAGNDTFDVSADGTAVRNPSLPNLRLAQLLRDKGRFQLATVTKSELGQEMMRSERQDGIVKEPASALPGARMRRDALHFLSHNCVVVDVVSGRNVSPATKTEFETAASYDTEAGQTDLSHTLKLRAFTGVVALSAPTGQYREFPTQPKPKAVKLPKGLL